MFEYIQGRLIEKNPSVAVIETGNIGYFIHISINTYTQLGESENCKLFIHQVIREDAQLLFGFITKQEREIFRLLISVSGVGANTARMILSSLSPSEIQRGILTDNVALLKSVKGIGLKTAQKIIIELKDKMIKLDETEETPVLFANRVRDEAVSALVMLGFPKSPVEKTVDKIIGEDKNITVELLVKKALKMM
jgi:holliday junction DNA helicase RuvA